MMSPIELLTEKLNDRYAPLEWYYPELEGRGAAHPLIKSGLLTYARRSATYNCPHACCDDPEREVIEEEDGSFTALCPGSAQPLKPTHEMLSVWRYNPERMAEILRGLLACEKIQEVNDATWYLGVSAHPALAGHRVYLQTRAATDLLERARSAAPHAPYILLTGSIRALKESELARQPTFTFAEVLSLSATGTPSLTPSAFATLSPLTPTATAANTEIAESLQRNTRAVNAVGTAIKTLTRHFYGDYKAPQLRSARNNELVIKAVEKYWQLVRDGTPPRQATTDACRAIEETHGLANYANFTSFRDAVKREITKHAHTLKEYS